MAVQYDFQAGLDPSALSSITQSQLLQMIQQMAPLNNIGGIVWQAGTSLNATIAQGTGGSPSVTDNPRFARYMWMNTYSAASAAPTPYYYDASTGNWTANAVAAGTITNANVSASAAIAVTKLAFGTARYLLRTNAAGTANEFVAPIDAFNTGELPVGKLIPNGSNGYLKTSSGATVWVADATERAAISSGLTFVASQITGGSAGQFLGNIAGTNQLAAFDSIAPSQAVGLSKLAQGGAISNDVLYWNGTTWAKGTPIFNLFLSVTANTNGIDLGLVSAITTGSATAHGLGSRPRVVRGVLRCVTNDAGFLAGTEVPMESFIDNGAPNNNAFAYGADNTYVYFTVFRNYSAAGNIQVVPYTTGAPGAAPVNITLANWRIALYAFI